jgi:uridine kinase
MLRKKEPFLIGVAGGISSGKSSVCKKIIDELAVLNKDLEKRVLIISLDSFYKRLSEEDRQRAERHDINLDHPAAFDDKLAYSTLTDLMQGKTVQLPCYEKKTYRFAEKPTVIDQDEITDVIIIEGILVFYYPEIRNLCQMKLFVDCDADTRLARRVTRDLREFNRPLDLILSYYQKFVKPAFEEFCLPTKKYADVIIPRGSENVVAINLIVQHLNEYLNSTGIAPSGGSCSVSATYSPRGSRASIMEKGGKANNNSGRLADGGASNLPSPLTMNLSPQKPSSSILKNSNSPSTPTKKTDFSSRPH